MLSSVISLLQLQKYQARAIAIVAAQRTVEHENGRGMPADLQTILVPSLDGKTVSDLIKRYTLAIDKK